ncbi:hypothetical protein [Archangium lansingense]|uniref:Uncharacterized protein n=1 Tax=Archangium lansingense TaxID=2995310 RepID=A0ABT4A1F9_9BACT|nr:hypothetical protein [Archangium lansinium]MCY1074827.1 hypothetical protein [Archangium lansinium]
MAAVSLPTRAYAGPMLTAGFLCERSIYKQVGGAASFELGASVFVQDGQGWFKAIVERPAVLPDGSPALNLTIAKGARELLPARKARRIRRSARAHKLNGSRKTYDQHTPATSTLCEQLLKGDVGTFLATPGLDCLMIGSVRETLEELSSPELWAVEPSGKARGNLAEIVRPLGLEGIGQSWHSRVIGTHSPQVAALAAQRPELVVLDGAQACRRWCSSFPESELVMALDRSAPDVVNGANTILEMYANRLDGDGPDLPTVPDGIEVTLFRVARMR